MTGGTATPGSAQRRLVLFHAHPDDETICSGASMAHYAAEGAAVTLVTSTLGEEGEILVPELAQLAAGQADQLGGYRYGELAAAMDALGVTDWRLLGGPGRYRDSGMSETAANSHPRAFCRLAADRAAFDAAVGAAVAVLREVRPQVVVTYDPDGEYGHPDHVMTHRVAMAAVDASADPGYACGDASVPWQVSKVYWTAVPRSVLERAGRAVRQAGVVFTAAAGWEDFGFGAAEEDVTAALGNDGYQQAKAAALAAHATQITVDGGCYALSNNLGREVLAREFFRLARGVSGGPFDEHGRETDLFAGL